MAAAAASVREAHTHSKHVAVHEKRANGLFVFSLDDEASADAAAIKLQAAYRGHLTRRALDSHAVDAASRRSKADSTLEPVAGALPLWPKAKIRGVMVINELYEEVKRAREIMALDEAVADARRDKGASITHHVNRLLGRDQRTGLLRHQAIVHTWYTSPTCQYAVAGLIMLNFLSNLIEKEIDPQSTLYPQHWRLLENSFNALFLFEFLINMYAHWFFPFFVSSWNQFDMVVVSVGCVSFFVPLIGPLKLLRTLRAVRVFRVFKRVESLNKIVAMVASAIPGVFSTSVMIVIVLSIYAMIGVEFFSTFGTSQGTDGECEYFSRSDGSPIPTRTQRHMCAGAEYFGSYSRAWYTLFQVRRGGPINLQCMPHPGLPGPALSRCVVRACMWTRPVRALSLSVGDGFRCCVCYRCSQATRGPRA